MPADVSLQGLRRLAQRLSLEQDAEDHVHDAMVAGLETPGQQRSGAWFRTVLRNTIRGRWRTAKRRAELDALLAEPAVVPLPDETAERQQLAALLREALHELDEPFRSTLQLRFFGDMTPAQIAEDSGCPSGTVRWRIHEGLRRLRTSIDRRNGGRSRWYGALAAPMLGRRWSIPILSVGSLAMAACWIGLDPSAETAPQEPTSTTELTADVASPVLGDRVAQTRSAPTENLADASTPPASVSDRTTHHARSAGPSQEELQECAEQNIASFNRNADDPNADEYLADAAQCYEALGRVGKAIHVHNALLKQFPDSRHAEASRAHSERLSGCLFDPEAELHAPAGRDCVAPIEELEGNASAQEYVAAAECLYKLGPFVGAALKYRELAAQRPGPFDRVANDAAIEKYEAAIARLAPKVPNPQCTPRP